MGHSSKMVRVWRLEDAETGLGVYQVKNWYGTDGALMNRACSIADLAGIRDMVSLEHPGPVEDGVALRDAWHGIRQGSVQYLFGFLDLAQAARWFPEYGVLARLQEHGAVLCEYEVPAEHVVIGAKQVLFRHDAARRVATVDILTELRQHVTRVRALKLGQHGKPRARKPIFSEKYDFSQA